jgi:hypothetical protein
MFLSNIHDSHHESRTDITYLLESINERENLRDPDADGRKVSNWILDK